MKKADLMVKKKKMSNKCLHDHYLQLLLFFPSENKKKKKNKLNETQTISTLFSATLKLKVTSVSPSPGQLTFD